jgi:hypothetical protein
MMSGGGGVHEIAAQPPKMRKRPALVGGRTARVANDVGNQDRGELSRLAHSSGSPALRIPSRTRAVCAW